MADWDDFTDRVEELSAQVHLSKCLVGAFLAELDDGDRPKFQALLDSPTARKSVIARELRKEMGNKAPTEGSLTRHGRGDCKCDRSSS